MTHLCPSVFICGEFLKHGTIFSLNHNQFLVGWGPRQYLQNPISDHYNFYFPDFFLSHQTPWFTHEYCTIIDRETLTHNLSNQNIDKSVHSNWHTLQQPIFEEQFHQLKSSFSSGDLQKAVPYIFEENKINMSLQQLACSLHNLLQYTSKFSVYIYGFWDETEGMLGATPEKLFTQQGNLLETQACAGTAKTPELLNETKIKLEHHLVVEGISNSLSSLGKITTKEQFFLNLSKFSHLVTPIHVMLNKNQNFMDFVKALHPTPALGAYPKEAGKKWLVQYDSFIKRKRYGAPVGYMTPNDNRANCYVAIRNVQWDNNGMQLGAGCGIVKSSQFADEWDEIQLKLQSIKEMLAL